MEENQPTPRVPQRAWQPRQAPSSAARDLEVAGRRIVDELRDQLADGQLETQLGMQAAAADLRRSAQDLQSVVRAPVEQARKLLEGLPEVLEQVSRSVHTLQQAVVDAAVDRVSNSVDGALAALENAVEASVLRISATADEAGRRSDAAWVELLALNQRLYEEAEASVARSSAAVDVAVQAAEQALPLLIDAALGRVQGLLNQHVEASAERLRGATGDSVTEGVVVLTEAVNAAVEGLEGAADRAHRQAESATFELMALRHKISEDAAMAVERASAAVSENVQAMEEAMPALVEQAVLRLQQALDEQVDLAVGKVRAGGADVAQDLRNQIDRLDVQRDQMRSELADLIAHAEAGERRRNARVDARVGRLVDRSQSLLDAAGASLVAGAAQLAERDERLERDRAEQFVRVLEELLSNSGLRRRRLREGVLKGLAGSPSAPVVLDTQVRPIPAEDDLGASEPVTPTTAKRPARRSSTSVPTATTGPRRKVTEPKSSTPVETGVAASQAARRRRTPKESS